MVLTFFQMSTIVSAITKEVQDEIATVFLDCLESYKEYFKFTKLK